jgi:TonB family protein
LSSAPARAPLRPGIPPRKVARYPLSVPVDVTVLRSGVPDIVPGRLVDVCEGGLAAVLAADLHPGDSVGVQLRLPEMGVALQAKAIIRHRAALRYGMEFLALPAEHQAMIRYWIDSIDPRPAMGPRTAASSLPGRARTSWFRTGKELRRVLWAALAVAALAGGIVSWQWYVSWRELESRVPAKLADTNGLRVNVPAELIQQQLIHKVDPIYPQAALDRNVQGIVVLHVVIGRDGTVSELRPVSGPPELAPAALDAVKWWRFRPYLVDGEPVEVETELAIEFRPQ